MCNISLLYINRGIERGMVKGIEKGVLKEKMSVILEMFKKDIPVQTIADVVHLSVEETEKIINDNT
ncbi:MAG: hypothetical protein ACI4K7_10815 [Oscillospiraceae bacterium]